MQLNTGNTKPRWATQIASDVVRDGIGYELLDVRREVVAEAFRCDADKTVSLTLWLSECAVSEDVLNWYLPQAVKSLGSFEDGSPLPPLEHWPIYYK